MSVCVRLPEWYTLQYVYPHSVVYWSVHNMWIDASESVRPLDSVKKKKYSENALVMYFWAVYLNISFFPRRRSFQMNKSGMMWRSFMKEYLFFFVNAFITSGTGVSCLDNNAEFDVLATCMIEWRWYYIGKPGGFNDGSCDVCVLTELSPWQQLSNDLHSFFPPIIPFLMLWAAFFAFSAVIGQTVCCRKQNY